MSSLITRILALMGISAALAMGGVGVARASPDHGHSGGTHCENLHGKKKSGSARRAPDAEMTTHARCGEVGRPSGARPERSWLVCVTASPPIVSSFPEGICEEG